MDFLLSHHTLLISITQIILIIWHPIQQCFYLLPSGMDTLKKVYTQLISALNDVRIQKSTNSALCALWNGKSQNTYTGQVKASSGVVKCDDIEFFDWSLHNSCTYFWSCDDIGKCQSCN
jgi:hypothetical protein